MNRTPSAGLGLLLGVACFGALNLFASAALRGCRMDLTQDGVYTLSEGTRNVLARLDEPVTATLYFSEEVAQDSPSLLRHGRRVRELLEEYEALADGMLELEVVEPLAFSEEEDAALAAGLDGPATDRAGTRFFFGLVLRDSVDDVQTVPFFDPARAEALEFELTQLFTRLGSADRTVVGLVSSTPWEDPGAQPGAPAQPWVLRQFLELDHELRVLGEDLEAVPEDVDVLLIAHPKALTPAAEYAIDQYALGGGRVLAFVDPHAFFDPGGAQPGGFPGDSTSHMDRLLGAWGLELVPSRIVGDVAQAQLMPAQDGGAFRFPLYLALDPDHLSQEDFVTRDLELVSTLTPGELKLLDGHERTAEVLARTSEDGAGAVDTMRMQFQPDLEEVASSFAPSGGSRVLAVRLSGPVRSAFPDGPPPSDPADPDSEPVPEPPGGHRSASSAPFQAIVVADTDLLRDPLWSRRRGFLGRTIIEPVADNGRLVQNAVENLAGSSDLISLRSRSADRRPFVRKEELSRAAEERYREKSDELQARLEEAEAQLAALSRPSEGAEDLFRAAQEEEVARYRADRDRIRKELREVRYRLNEDIEDLGTALFTINLALPPLLVAVLGLVLLLLRPRAPRRKSS